MKIKNFNLNKIKKVKPGNLRITTIDNRFYNDVPFVNSKKSLPRWFRSIHKGNFSVRSCSGISDFLEIGATIPAWTSFKFTPNIESGSWDCETGSLNPMPTDFQMQMVSGFPFHQTGSCPMTHARKIEKMAYPKLITPWRIQTAPGWSILVLPIYYEENSDYSVLPAVVNTDYYQIVNIVLNVKTDVEFLIQQGTPLAHIIPIQRKNDIKNIECIDEKFYKYASSGMYLTGGISPAGSTGLAYRKAAKIVDSAINKD